MPFLTHFTYDFIQGKHKWVNSGDGHAFFEKLLFYSLSVFCDGVIFLERHFGCKDLDGPNSIFETYFVLNGQFIWGGSRVNLVEEAVQNSEMQMNEA